MSKAGKPRAACGTIPPGPPDRTELDSLKRLRGAEVLPPMQGPQHPPASADKSPGTTTRKRSAGRFAVLNAFVDAVLAELCRGDIVVWLILYRDTRDGTARTSQANIARRAGLTDRGVRAALRRLEGRGLLKCVYRGGLNRGASRYRVLPTAEPMSSAAQRKSARRD